MKAMLLGQCGQRIETRLLREFRASLANTASDDRGRATMTNGERIRTR